MLGRRLYEKAFYLEKIKISKIKLQTRKWDVVNHSRADREGALSHVAFTGIQPTSACEATGGATSTPKAITTCTSI